MTFFLTPILIIGVILFVSRMLMQKIKEDDRREGLELDDKEYTIRKTIKRPSKQEKRIEKMTTGSKPVFSECMKNVEHYDERMAKCVLILAAGVLFAIICHANITTYIISTLLIIWLFKAAKIRILIFTDLFLILNYFCINNAVLTYIVIVPVMIYINYYYFAAYMIFRQSIDTN